MARKAQLLNQAAELKLEVTDKNTIKEIEEAITSSGNDLVIENNDDDKVTKAGKNSAKAIREAEELAEKEERKAKIAAGELDASADADGNVAVKSGPIPVTRSKLERRGKKYKENYAKIDRSKEYTLKEALQMAIDTASTKFDSSVELHIRLNVDPKQADQNVRGTIGLPHGTGKTIRVAVLATADKQAEAREAGADIVGEQDLLDKIEAEEIEFETLISTPDMMAKLGRYARVLGPKGLMPNPKSGTVTPNVGQAVKQAKAGQVEYRTDSQGIIHQGIGKVSFGADKLDDNADTYIKAVKEAKPASIKTNFIQSAYVTTTMGPSIKTKL